MSDERFDIGDVVVVTGNFSRKGVALFPENVECTVQPPKGEVLHPDVVLVEDEDGKRYEAEVIPTVDGGYGDWQVRMWGTDEDGKPVAATPTRFKVRKSNVPLDD